MRNLFVFLAKNHAFFLFLFLLGCSMYITALNKKHQQAFLINSSNVFTGNIYNAFDNVSEYFYLKAVNDSLMAENARLKSTQLQSSFTVDTVASYNIADSLYRQIYSYIPAKVINNSVHKYNNTLTLNRGSRHGIAPGMGVIHASGTVGKVIYVTEDFSAVMSVLHKDNKMSCKILNKGARGTLFWDGNNSRYASLEYVSQPVELEIGDTVVTAGTSTIYPEGIMVGRISEFELKPGSNFYRIELELSTAFNSLQYVYVVNHFLKDQQQKLEELTKGD